MNQSENINELACALSKAQGEMQASQEGLLIKKILCKKFSVKKAKDNIEKFYEKVAFGLSNCWYWIGFIDRHGYGRTRMLGEKSAHRSSWKLFHGDIPKDTCVLHKCDVPNCVNPDHLFLGSHLDNMLDMKSKFRNKKPKIKFGEECNFHKLKSNDVLEIRNLIEQKNIKYTELAAKYNVQPKTISRIANRKLWSNI